MTQDPGPFDEIRDVLTGAAAAATGAEAVPEGAMMNEAQGPMDTDRSPMEVPAEEQEQRPTTIDVDDTWGIEGEHESGGDTDFVPGDPVTNDLTDADPDARPEREVPDPQTRPGD